MFPKIGVFPPKWMVTIMENPIKMDDLGGKPTIFGNIQMGAKLNAGFEYWFIYFPEPWGQDSMTSILFKWVGSTTN